MHDLKNNIKVVQAVAPAALTKDTVSGAIDLAGYESAAVIMDVGVITDGKWGLEISECDTADGQFAAVDGADLIGQEPTGLEPGTGKGSGTAPAVGYKGFKRYLKVTVKEEAASTTGAVIGSVVILGHPAHAPVA